MYIEETQVQHQVNYDSPLTVQFSTASSRGTNGHYTILLPRDALDADIYATSTSGVSEIINHTDFALNAEYGVNSYSLNGSRARLSETDPALASMYRLSQSMAVLDARGTMGSSFLPSLERKHINGVRLDIRTSVDNRVITIWLIRFAINPTAIRLVDKECHFPDSIFMSQKVLSKARALWPFVGGCFTSEEEGSAVTFLVGDPNSILQFQDEDLGKNVPTKTK